MIMRAWPRAVASANARAALAGRDDVRADVAERDERAVALERGEAAEPAPRDVLEEDALDRLLRAEGENLIERRVDEPCGVRWGEAIGLRAMPIHVRAEPGDYAEAVLLPGDPLRAKYIAETYLDDVVQTNSERGMLGFRGTWEGKPVSVQATGMGCPSAAIVIEELVMLGCKRLLRVGTCGGLQPHHALGDMIVAITAVPQDRTVDTYVDDEPHCPTADWGLVHGAVHAAKELGQPMHVGPVVSSDVFYNPDGGQYQRWSDRGILAVEMEAAILFTLGALRKVQRGLPARPSATSSSRASSSGSATTSCAPRSTG